ncbi:MAG: hypothetical protein ACP5RD_04280 [bacterium]
MMETILEKFKNTKDLIAIIIIDLNLNIKELNKLNEIQDTELNNLIEILKKILINKIDKNTNKVIFNYISFNYKENIIIIFSYKGFIIVLVGNKNLKEPIIRSTIKSLN